MGVGAVALPARDRLARAEPWATRPATSGNVPLIGRSARPGLWLNTGHGTLMDAGLRFGSRTAS